MTHTEDHRNGGLTLFLAFVGGALVGGVAAVLFAPRSGAETRRLITGAAEDTKREVASRIPQAIREASSAAQAAFAAAMQESAKEDAAGSRFGRDR
jgi:gas vesicle protein